MNKFLLIIAIICFIAPAHAQETTQVKYIADKYKKIYYTSIEEAERKIIQYHKERVAQEISDYEIYQTFYFPYEMFKSLVRSDERTLQYDFDFGEVDEIWASDGTLKLYSWSYGDYATYGEDRDGIVTYKSKGQYLYHESEETPDGYRNLDVPIDAYRIETIISPEGYRLFLFFSCHRIAVTFSEWVTAYIISNALIEPYHLFIYEGELTSTLRRNTSSSGYHEGGIEYKNEMLMVSQEGWLPFDSWPPIASGYTDVYKYNGQRFVYTETVYDEKVPLYTKLRNFKHNVVCLEFLPWKVRIDEMPDGTFRYASWKSKDMSEAPDLIIPNGEYGETEIDKGWQGKIVSFTFKNNGYDYIVSYEHVEYNRYYDLTPISLVVKHNNKVIMNINHKD